MNAVLDLCTNFVFRSYYSTQYYTKLGSGNQKVTLDWDHSRGKVEGIKCNKPISKHKLTHSWKSLHMSEIHFVPFDQKQSFWATLNDQFEILLVMEKGPKREREALVYWSKWWDRKECDAEYSDGDWMGQFGNIAAPPNPSKNPWQGLLMPLKN